MFINVKKHSEIGVFLDSTLNFTIRIFTRGLANDYYYYLLFLIYLPLTTLAS